MTDPRTETIDSFRIRRHGTHEDLGNVHTLTPPGELRDMFGAGEYDVVGVDADDNIVRHRDWRTGVLLTEDASWLTIRILPARITP